MTATVLIQAVLITAGIAAVIVAGVGIWALRKAMPEVE